MVRSGQESELLPVLLGEADEPLPLLGVGADGLAELGDDLLDWIGLQLQYKRPARLEACMLGREKDRHPTHLRVQRDCLPPQLVEALAADDVARHHHQRREQTLAGVHVAHHPRRRPKRPRTRPAPRHGHHRVGGIAGAGHGAGPRRECPHPGEGHSGRHALFFLACSYRI